MLSALLSGVPGNWRKSSHSGQDSDCAEVGSGSGRVLVRDTKDRGGAVLAFGPRQWQAFTDQVKNV